MLGMLVVDAAATVQLVRCSSRWPPMRICAAQYA
jgi:hypothetical protein